MKLLKPKGCRRCGGDLFLERDSEGISVTCLQCSANYSIILPPEPPPKPKPRKVLAH